MLSTQQVYKDQDKIYHADTCQPLIAANQEGKLQLEAWGRFTYPGRRIEPEELTGVNSIGYWDAHFRQSWGLDWHRNEGIEITFLESGQIPFALENKAFTLNPDEITITRPWQPHRVGDPTIGAGKLFWLILDVGVRHPHQEWIWPDWIMLTKADLTELTRMLRQNEQPVWKASDEIKLCFQRLGSLLKNKDLGKVESWIKVYINEILLHLLDSFRCGQIPLSKALTEGRRTVELFIKDLNKTFMEPWTLDSMAAQCGLGITRFVHYFKQITNASPMQYLTNLRLEVAAHQLIHAPHLHINNIGYDCGFSSSEYFATVFRKQYGYSPKSYRLQHVT
ncbi:AraC family transcriptional regulator [Adhaeribacter aquaticus]|uniref:AraC family transcriptional regulator n=1 Tax=Adhaeribacter aquaticus TaxID=299567 RepID=UPI00040A4DB3|nr:AraC family transcriptional regulator [Adhaeribacter aquaticus]